MGFGMKLPQGQTMRRKVPASGTDENPNTKMAKNLTTPNLPDGDGPARDTMDGGTPKKPPTSAKSKSKSGIDKKTMKSMKSSLGAIGRY